MIELALQCGRRTVLECLAVDSRVIRIYGSYGYMMGFSGVLNELGAVYATTEHVKRLETEAKAREGSSATRNTDMLIRRLRLKIESNLGPGLRLTL